MLTVLTLVLFGGMGIAAAPYVCTAGEGGVPMVKLNELTPRELKLIAAEFERIKNQIIGDDLLENCRDYTKKCDSKLCKKIIVKFACQKKDPTSSTVEIIQDLGDRYAVVVEKILGHKIDPLYAGFQAKKLAYFCDAQEKQLRKQRAKFEKMSHTTTPESILESTTVSISRKQKRSKLSEFNDESSQLQQQQALAVTFSSKGNVFIEDKRAKPIQMPNNKEDNSNMKLDFSFFWKNAPPKQSRSAVQIVDTAVALQNDKIAKELSDPANTFLNKHQQKKQLKSLFGNQQDVLASVFNSTSQIPSPKFRKQQSSVQQSQQSQSQHHKFQQYQGVSQSALVNSYNNYQNVQRGIGMPRGGIQPSQQRYPPPIQQPVVPSSAIFSLDQQSEIRGEICSIHRNSSANKISADPSEADNKEVSQQNE